MTWESAKTFIAKWRSTIGIVAGLTVFSVALYALRHELRTYDFRQVRADLANVPNGDLFRAIGLTACGYLALILYDSLALRYVKRRLEAQRVAFAGFVAYAFSNALGFPLVLGGGLRYRFYNAWGLSSAEIAMIVGFVILFAIFKTRANEALSLTLFYVFAFCEGVGIAPVIGQYLRSVGSGVVVNAALTTGLGMFALAAIVYATGLDLRRFQGIFTIALLGLVVVGVISMFVKFVHPETYAWLTLVIFSGLVLIDFARIRAGGDGLTPVLMAVSIYLDAINIFLALLQILGGRRSSD